MGKIKQFVSKLKKNATPYEKTVKVALDHLKIKYDFQVPVYCEGKNYILDFVVYPVNESKKLKKIALEIDGKHHYEPEKMIYDAQRTAQLLRKGIKVIRFSNTEVRDNIAGVIDTIIALDIQFASDTVAILPSKVRSKKEDFSQRKNKEIKISDLKKRCRKAFKITPTTSRLKKEIIKEVNNYEALYNDIRTSKTQKKVYRRIAQMLIKRLKELPENKAKT